MASLCTNLFILLYYLALFAVVAEKEEVPVARDIPDPLKSLEKKGFSDVDVAKKINQCEIAVKYQMFHTLVLLAIGFAPTAGFRGGWRATCLLFLVGMLLFSGGLYSMVFWDRMGHWSIVPLGGSLLMIAWLSLAFNAFFLDKSSVGTGIPNG